MDPSSSRAAIETLRRRQSLASLIDLIDVVVDHHSDDGVERERLGCADPANGSDLPASTFEFVLSL